MCGKDKKRESKRIKKKRKQNVRGSSNQAIQPFATSMMWRSKATFDIITNKSIRTIAVKIQLHTLHDKSNKMPPLTAREKLAGKKVNGLNL